MTEPYLIKKYTNRRLYDTVASSHVTLAGIRKLIIQGNEIKVVDDATGEDITRSLLLQIVAEQEQGGQPMLDTELLMRLIRLYGNPMQNLMGEYLLKSADAFLAQQTRFQEQLRKAMATTPLAALTELADANVKLWQDLMLGSKPGDKDGPE